MDGWQPVAWRRRLLDDGLIEVRGWGAVWSVHYVPRQEKNRPRVDPERIALTETSDEAVRAADEWVARHLFMWAD